MAWNMIDNRVYQTYTHTLYVYRDDPTAIGELKTGQLGPMMTVLGNPARGAVRLRLQIPAGQPAALTVYDAAGRLVRRTGVAGNAKGVTWVWDCTDARSQHVGNGVYFICLEAGGSKATDKVIVQR
jgi:hypothetical protein